MALYLIGLGLDKESISLDAFRKLKECDKIYLENYTVNFPYKIEELEKSLNLQIIPLNREEVEGEVPLKESENSNMALLVYGDPLSATTHSSLILACIEKEIPYQIFHNSSIMTTISETGLQPYKFGKTTSMPNWAEHTNKPTSFIDTILTNTISKSHSLILTDISLNSKDALNQLKEASSKERYKLPEQIIILSNAGTKNQKIFYDTLENLQKKEIKMPFCIIIPQDLHFIEKEFLNEVKED